MKVMTPKERVLAFYRHKPMDEMPTREGVYTFPNPSTFHERPPEIQKGGYDWFGVHWTWEDTVNAQTPDHKQTPILEDICQWREVIQWPNLDAWDWSAIEEIDHISQIDRENKFFEMMFVNGPFERLHMLMGFEEALCALLTDPEEITAFFDAFMDWKIKLMEKVIELYKPDAILFHDDWGTQQNTFFSPDLWRELIKPQIQKAVDRCHELGVFFNIHSCGKMDAIVPDFVEMGIDAWQGQEINDIPALKAITGNRLAYRTTIDYQTYYMALLSGTMDEDTVRAEVRATILKNAQGYNYFPFFTPHGGRALEIITEETINCAKIAYT